MPFAAQSTRAQSTARLASLRLSACRQRGWHTSALRGLDQKLGGGDAQHGSECVQRIDGHVLRPALNTSDVRAIDLGRQCQPLLRQAAFDAELAEIPANDLADIHRQQESSMNGLTIDGPIVPYFNIRGVDGSCMLGEVK